MRLSELRRLSHSPVAVYNYYCTIKLSELGNNYQYPRYYQVKNKETVDIYCISMLEDCIVDDIEAVDNAIIALTHNDDYNCLRWKAIATRLMIWMIVRDFNKIEIKGDKLLKTFIGPDKAL